MISTHKPRIIIIKKEKRKEKIKKTHLKLPNPHLPKPGLPHTRLLHPIRHDRKAPPGIPPALNKRLAPLRHGARLGHGAVVAQHVRRRLVVLDPAARRERLVGLAVQRVPVGDGPQQVAHVDVVGRVGVEGPGLGRVVDLEGYVGRDPGGLDGRDVGAEDGGGGEGVSEVALFSGLVC